MEDAEVVKAIAYGMKIGNTNSFENCLDIAGFEPKFKGPRIIEIQDVKIKKCDWGIGLVMDIVESVKDYDVIVIGSSDFNLLPLVNWIKRQNVEVWIIASLIPKALKEAATRWKEIPEAWLEEEEEEMKL